jgi:erythromycin esterase
VDEPRTLRRRFLQTVAAAGLGTVAGCTGDDGDGTPERTDRTVTDETPTGTPPDRRTDEPPTDTPRGVDPSVVDGIEQRATPIGNVDPDAAADDLSAVATHLADARIVGMGEATHGTWEFHAIRHRLVRTLVTEHGLRAVAFEDNFSGLRPVDEYVRHGEGDLDTAMAAIGSYPFHSTEVRRMLSWLRSYNEGRPADDRVGVYGLDMQTPDHAAARVRSYLRQVDPAYLDTVDERLNDVEGSVDRQFDESEVERLLDTAAELRSRLEDRREAYVDASSQSAWQLALRHVRVIEQNGLWGEAHLEGETGKERLLMAFDVRDRMNAENATWLAEFVDGPIAFWAHNMHVKRGKRAEGPDGERPPAQGEFLAREHGSDYYPLMLTFGRGSFTARFRTGSLGTPEVDEPADGTVAEVGVEVDHPRFFLDFDAASADADVAAWLDRTHALHSVGLLWGGAVDAKAFRPRAEADGLLFVEETTPTELTGHDG